MKYAPSGSWTKEESRQVKRESDFRSEDNCTTRDEVLASRPRWGWVAGGRKERSEPWRARNWQRTSNRDCSINSGFVGILSSQPSRVPYNAKRTYPNLISSREIDEHEVGQNKKIILKRIVYLKSNFTWWCQGNHVIFDLFLYMYMFRNRERINTALGENSEKIAEKLCY